MPTLTNGGLLLLLLLILLFMVGVLLLLYPAPATWTDDDGDPPFERCMCDHTRYHHAGARGACLSPCTCRGFVSSRTAA